VTFAEPADGGMGTNIDNALRARSSQRMCSSSAAALASAASSDSRSWLSCEQVQP
jgi:hypothetical protein